MTAQVLTAELTNIFQESKKKNAELKAAADKSLQELKVLPSTSEAQITADVRRRPHLVNPFLLACKTGNTKLALPAVTCIQRLIVNNGFPPERLKDVLESFQECCKIGLDVQLKVLQSLPQLLQNYGDTLEGVLQSSLLQVCTTLQQAKSATISSTASAILQQIISLLFEKVENEDDRVEEAPIATEFRIEGRTVQVRPAAYDAYRVFEDLCLLTEGQKARFVLNATLSQSFGLELIEVVLANHGELFHIHPELAQLLRIQLMPLLTRLLSERLTFPVTVRTVRVLCMLLREHLDIVHVECEIALSLLNHFLDADGAMMWKRALCMETYRVVYSNPSLALELYSLFDQQDGKRNIIQENLATFVRLAAEKPALIGLGQQSSFPVGPKSSAQDQALLETGGVAGIISGELGIAEVNAPGISTQWSSMKISCLEQPDKAEPPSIPDTYAYSLVLTCLNGLSDSLAKIILPMTLPNQSRTEARIQRAVSVTSTPVEDPVEDSQSDDLKRNGATSPPPTPRRRMRAVPANPLTLTEHTSYAVVQTVAHLIDNCWPAILAASSTFLNAALDVDFYRGLIRSFQRFTQVAGLLRLSTPRDAFLTTLAKAAVPANYIRGDSVGSPMSATASPRMASTVGVFNSVDNFVSHSSTESPASSRRPSLDISGPSLSQRNLMCLRALINLAIALGSILGQSWPIVLENLQKADNILAQSGTIASARDYRSGTQSSERHLAETGSGQSTISSEIAAVEGAISRLFQSTSDYPNEAFLSLMRALCELITDSKIAESGGPNVPPSPMLQRTQSMSHFFQAAVPQARNTHFAIAKLGEVARINLIRLAGATQDNGWDLLTEKLLNISTSPTFDSVARLMAADVLGNVAVGITVTTVSEDSEIRSEIQKRSLASLESVVQKMYRNLEVERDSANTTDLDVHKSALEALRAILEQCGESLIAGWRIIFRIVETAFATKATIADTDSILEEEGEPGRIICRPISTKIARSAFASVQLICSDFLTSLKKERFVSLINIMSQFCSQTMDLNISLTTLTLFWELSDFLQIEGQRLNIELDIDAKLSPPDLEAKLIPTAESGSFTASWLVLQSRLASMTADYRADVRNGAIQTIFRIVDNSGEKLSAQVWEYCIRGVIFQVLDININAHARLIKSDSVDKQADQQSLHGTTDAVLKGLATVVTTHLDTVTKLPAFGDVWRNILAQFTRYLMFDSTEISTYVFEALIQILKTVESAESITLQAVKETVTLMEKNVPSGPDQAPQSSIGNEKALVAYVGALKQIYRLISPYITDTQINMITQNLQKCLQCSSGQAYTSDVDNMTNLQNAALSCLEMLRTDLVNVPSSIINCLASLMVLPYEQSTERNRNRSLSFIALSKRSMDIIQSMIVVHKGNEEIYTSGAVTAGLKSIAKSIELKYKWEKQGREPSMWKRATSVGLEITSSILPAAKVLRIDDETMTEIWCQVVDIARNISDADRGCLPSNDILLVDETFDLVSLQALRRHMTAPPERKSGGEKQASPLAWLGNPSIPKTTRHSYVEAFFQTSLMHETSSLQGTTPLTNLYKTRTGRTYDPAFNPRIRMCYSCLDELFSLVCAYRSELTNQSPSSRTRIATVSVDEFTRNLAEAAFPFLILRCALPLKRYIADQPLRGRMPTPTSQRLELLYILRKIQELHCEVSLPIDSRELGGKRLPMLSPRRRHLEWLVPLVNQATGFARKDREVADEMQKVLALAYQVEED